MVKQYPYTLYAETRAESYQNDDGDWVIAESEKNEIGKCRDEVGGSGSLVTTQDGQQHQYAWMIYAPLNTPIIEPNTIIEVVDENGIVRANGKVIRFSKDQMHVRIWV